MSKKQVKSFIRAFLEIDTKKTIDDAEEILMRIINDCAEKARLQAYIYEGGEPAFVDTGASDWDSVIGGVRFFPTAEIDDDGEEILPADNFDAFCAEIEKYGIPADCVDKSDDERELIITFQRGFWITAFRKFDGFAQKYKSKVLDKVFDFKG